MVITGQSGIGKSTLLKLLHGIFKPEAGELYFECGEDKLPVDRITRRMFAYVPQGNLLLSGAPILLLDESTSALDEDTERRILERIRTLQDRTCIAVTHRPAAIAVCDRNIVIEDRKIVRGLPM